MVYFKFYWLKKFNYYIFREATYEDGEDVTCEFHNPDFIICSSILSFYIPCIIIIFIYVSVYKVGT